MENELKNVGWDQAFSVNKAHGSAAQCSMIEQAVSHCTARRCAVDVGAHIGLTAIPLANAGFEKVIAFEAVWENFDCLYENTKAFDAVRAIPIALGDKAGTTEMKLPDENNSGCWYADGEEGNTPMLMLDNFKLQHVDFIKIDVEGREGDVLLGGYFTIREQKPVVVIEQKELAKKYFGNDAHDARRILQEIGYKFTDRIRNDEIWTC